MRDLSSEKIYLGAGPEQLADKVPVPKSRAVIHNQDGVMLLEDINGVLLLPGGQRKSGEDDRATLWREAKEETGLVLPEDAEPELICKINNYSKYFPHQSGETVEKYTETAYYSVLADLSLRGVVSLTDNEKEGNLQTVEVYEDFVRAVIENHNKHTYNLRWPFYEREILVAMDEYFAMKNASLKAKIG
jgi:8-oxo-dGTP pyrophosphatase MutT (NUDIX family)